MRALNLTTVENLLARRSTRYHLRLLNRRLVLRARQRDAQNNAETSPPQDELIAWRGVWLAEAYTLSMLPALGDQLARIRPRATSFGSREFDSALAALREIGAMQRGGFSWIPLGLVSAGGGGLPADPPSGAVRVDLSLHAPLPSVAVVVAAFLFDGEYAVEPTRLLTHEWITELDPSDGILYPEFRKAREIRKLRFERKRHCRDWLANTVGLRGVFAQGELEGSRYPATEWWTTSKATPFDPARTSPRRRYMEATHLSLPIATWTSEELGNQRLTEADSDEISVQRRHSYSLVVAGREDELFAGEDLSGDGVDLPEAWFMRLEIDVAAVTALWSIFSLMRVYERRLASVREALQGLEPRKLRRSLRRFAAVEEHRIEAEGDLVPLLRDLAHGAEPLERATTFYSGLHLVSASASPLTASRPMRWRLWWRPAASREPETWVQLHAKAVAARAERLLEREASLRQLSDTLATALNARSNLKLQRRILWLTWVLVVIAIATLTVTLFVQLR